MTPPERHHLIICGHSRAGTTLLFEMLRQALHGYAFPDRETSFVAVPPDGPARIVTKRPLDVFRLDRLAEAARRRRVSVLLALRDPRGLLSSRHAAVPGDYFYHADRQYFVPPDGPPRLVNPGLLSVHDAIRRAEAAALPPGVTLSRLRFEDLLGDPGAVGTTLRARHGLPLARSLAGLSPANPPPSLARALNGARPLDPDRVGAWRAPGHAARLSDQFRRFPKLFAVMADGGYTWEAADLDRLGLADAAAAAGHAC
jgi:hypothetical protein